MIRRLGPQDWSRLRDIRLAGLQESPEAFGSTYAREAAFDEAEWRARAADNAWFVAVDDHHPTEGDPAEVGGIVAGFRDPDVPPHQRHLVAMWVAPAARGSGVARDLVMAVVEWARADGATELTLGVADGNDRARALYMRCGFAATGERFALHSDPTRGLDILRLPL